MKAVVTVVGRDAVGILAKVSAVCAEHNANILDVSQAVLSEMFSMVMVLEISDLTKDFSALQDDLSALGERIGMKIHTMHEDIFNAMHHI
ncbi:MAG: ACT domain-containing protein [Clostridia bacterium]|nr:ACT domain-containing protein [Clostridia bacterium]MBQ3708158.1 ACT domain-containing protein [Clostridia bacterium]MCR4905932.1 ACT domain-containing protein [Clostridiales bacterium]